MGLRGLRVKAEGNPDETGKGLNTGRCSRVQGQGEDTQEETPSELGHQVSWRRRN